MTELGSRLRMAREEKKLTLEELQNLTRIQKKYLVGIEEGNYSIMPGKFYARAFIKQYAEAVGLQPEELFEEYKHEIPLAYEDDLPEQLSRVQTRGAISANASKFMEVFPKILIGIFIVAALYGGWYVFSNYIGLGEKNTAEKGQEDVGYQESDVAPPSKEDSGKDTTGESDKDENAPEEEPVEESPKQELQMAGVNGKVTTYNLVNAEEFVIEVKATNPGNTWVTVRDSSKKTHYDNFLKNGASESYDLTDQSEVLIVAGASNFTEIYVNGEQLTYELDPAKHVRQDIKIVFEKEE